MGWCVCRYDFLVLPESSITALREKARAQNLLPEGEGPAVEWQRLAVLLKLLDETTELWGLPKDLYGVNTQKNLPKIVADTVTEITTPDDLEKEAKAMRWFCHPNMPFRTTWDLIQVCLLLYLLIIVPLRVAFDLNVDFASVAWYAHPSSL
jgi:hypothetical protein